MTVPHHANLRQLAERQDDHGAFARGRLKLALITEALCGDLGQEDAAEWWRISAEFLDELAEVSGPGSSIPRLADRLRGIAAVIEEADLA